jgi:hypothetical protein
MLVFLLILLSFFLAGSALRRSTPETRMFVAMFFAFILAALYFILERFI